MTAYYYVKSGGTATGDGGRYATKQTGAFAGLGASGYYDTWTDAAAATTAPAVGDYYLTSDLHNEVTYAVTIINHDTAGVTPVYFVTVSDTAIDETAVASSAQMTITEGQFQGVMYLYGLYLKWAFYNITGYYGGHVQAESCTFSATSSFTNSTNHDGLMLHATDCTFIGDSNTHIGLIDRGYRVELHNCTFSGMTDSLTTAGFDVGGGILIADSCDFSSITGTLIKGVGGATSDDGIDVRITNCDLHASLSAFTNEEFLRESQRVTVTGSGSGAAAEYQFHITAFGGDVDEDTSIYRDGSTAFPSGTKTALKAVTNAKPVRGKPFWFEFPTRYAELSNTASDTVRIYILSSATLTDVDVWAEAYYADGTNINTWNAAITRVEPFDTGTTLDTNTEAWAGRTAENRYQIDLDTSVDPGADCVPIIRVYVAKASATIYFCTSVDLV